MGKIDLYHGSKEIIDFPLPISNISNDFGAGLYCTEHIELAKEWACKNDEDGIVNHYQIDLSKYKVLDLTNKDTLEWLAVLVKHRNVRISFPVAKEAREWLLKNYLFDISGYDVIKGYRADDAYFSFVRDFLNNIISLETLNLAMSLGDLGIQYAVKTKEAFLGLEYLGYEVVSKAEYYPKTTERNFKARKRYFEIASKQQVNEKRILDLMREKNE